MSNLIIFFQTALSLICLSVGGVLDWRDREVPNILWLYQIGGGMVLLLFQFYFDPPAHALSVVGNITIGIFIGITMFTIGAWGGADAKAIIALSVSSPSVSVLFLDTSHYLFDFFPPIIFILFNFMLILLLFALSLIIGGLYKSTTCILFEQPDLNLSSRFALLMSCIKIKINQDTIASVTHVDFVEQFDDEINEWRIKLSLFMPEEEEELDLETRTKRF